MGFVWRKMSGEMDKMGWLWVVPKEITIAKDFVRTLNANQGKW